MITAVTRFKVVGGNGANPPPTTQPHSHTFDCVSMDDHDTESEVTTDFVAGDGSVGMSSVRRRQEPADMTNSELEQRLASTETDVRHLAESVDSLTRSVSHRFDDVLAKLDTYSQRGAITWPLIFTAVTTLLGCATIAGVIHSMSINPVIQGVAANAVALQRHADQDGHPEAMKQAAVLRNDVDRLDSRIETLDEMLQREMRLLDATNMQRLDHLDETLQREVRLLLDARKIESDAVTDRLIRAEQWITDHDQSSLRADSSQWERIRALERSEYGAALPSISTEGHD